MRSVSSALVALAMASVALSAPGPWESKVHPRVLAASREAPVEFLVVLDEQARVPAPHREATREERGALAVAKLREVAAASQAPLIELLEASGAEYRPFWIVNMLWVKADRDTLERIASRRDVRRVDANPRLANPRPRSVVQPLKSGGAVEWNVNRIGADAVWDLGFTGQGVVIGAQDTGYAWEHPALVNRYRGWDGVAATHDYNWHDAIHASDGPCPGDSVEPCDDHGHGTHTLGTMIGDDGGSNRIGVAPGAAWIACRNMDQGNGTPASYSECFEWFVAPTDTDGQNPDPARAPDVINNSWGCPPFEGCSADTLRAVIDNTRAAGIVVVASAGNSGDACASISSPPSIYASSFSVGATDSTDLIAGFSSRGPVTADGSGRLKPDLAAPGVGVRSSVPGDGYGVASGTSMAGPHVAGAVALLLSARPDLKGQVAVIEELLRRSAVPQSTTDACGGDDSTTVPNHTYGAGRLDALELVTGDADGDGVANLDDCAPLDAGATAIPEPVLDLRLQGGALSTLGWTGRPGDELLRSESVQSFEGAVCLDPGGGMATDDAVPAGLFAYLVRTANACGTAVAPASAGPRSTPECR